MENAEKLVPKRTFLAAHTFEVALAVVLGALFLFYFFLWQQKAPLYRLDSYGYLETSQDLNDWSLEELHRRSPGYPILMRLTGVQTDQDSGQLLFFVQLLMHFGMTAVAVLTLRALQVRRVVPLVVLLVLALEPLIVGASALAMSETFTIFLVVVGTCALLLYLNGRSWLYALLSGAMLGYLTLVRPTFQLLAAVVVGILVLAALLWPHLRRRAAVAGVFNVLFTGLLLCGFILFNKQQFGFGGLTPLAGFNLATRTPHALELIPDEYAAVREILIRYRHDTITTEPHKTSPIGITRYIWAAVPELKAELGMNDIELAEFLVDINVDLIRRAPNLYIEEVSMMFGNYWQPFSPDPVLVRGAPFYALSGLHALKVIFILLMTGALTTALLLFLLTRRSVGRMVAARLKTADHVKLIGVTLWLTISLYNLLISIMMDVGSPRHRLPTDMLLIMSAVIALDYLLHVRQLLPALAARLQPARA